MLGLFLRRLRIQNRRMFRQIFSIHNPNKLTRLRAFKAFVNRHINPVYILHVGNFMALCAIGMTQMLWLRSFMVGASFCAITFNLLQPVPARPPIFWGSALACGHFLQIVRLLLEMKEVELSTHELDLYECAFLPYGFTPRQFVKLKEHSKLKWNHLPAGHILLKEGEPMPSFWYLQSGKISITRSGLLVGEAEPGNGAWLGFFWVDENISTLERSEYTYYASEPSVVVEFNREEVREFMSADIKLLHAAHAIQAADLWSKMQNQSQTMITEAYRHMIEIALLDGVLAPQERYLLELFRDRHPAITEELHEELLGDFGWSVEDFERGRKKGEGPTAWLIQQIHSAR